MSGERLELSVVTMLYRSEAYLREFHARALSAAGRLTPSFELVYVDDGSPDASAATVRELAAGDPRVVLVELSRNFGHHRAAVAGIAHAHGRRVFMLDVDLEERPEWLPEFSAQMDGSGADVVFGVSVVRKGDLPAPRAGRGVLEAVQRALRREGPREPVHGAADEPPLRGRAADAAGPQPVPGRQLRVARLPTGTARGREGDAKDGARPTRRGGSSRCSSTP